MVKLLPIHTLITILLMVFSVQITASHYRITGSVTPAERLEIESLLQEVGRRYLPEFKLGPEVRLTVYVCGDLQEFLKLTRASGWNGGHFKGRTIYLQRLAVLRQRGILARTLTHEFLHYCIQKVAGRNCPPWLNEGLALSLTPEARQIGCFDQEKPYLPVSLRQLDRDLRAKDRAKAKQAYCRAARVVGGLLRSAGFETVLRALEQLKIGNKKPLMKLQDRTLYFLSCNWK